MTTYAYIMELREDAMKDWEERTVEDEHRSLISRTESEKSPEVIELEEPLSETVTDGGKPREIVVNRFKFSSKSQSLDERHLGKASKKSSNKAPLSTYRSCEIIKIF